MSRGSRGSRGAIDWPAVHERLARVRAAVDGAEAPDAATAAAVLDERARRLAGAAETAEARAEGLELTRFVVAGAAFAIDAEVVRRIVRTPALTPVPRAPEILLGVTALHGEVLPVFAAAALLAVAGGATTGGYTLVLGVEAPELGLACDGVEDVSRVRVDELAEPLGGIDGGLRGLCRGVRADGLVVLDGRRVLADPRLWPGRPRGPQPGLRA